MEKEEPNVVLDQSKCRQEIRDEAMRVLATGADFVLLVPTWEDGGVDSLAVATTMSVENMRACLIQTENDLRHVRDGMNN